ncbi:MAG: hypothetical protein NC489_41605 [Ruminococcus flavefaciens]|nr:hypothetical protein [Ruminococcus flavefaciens]
MHTFPGLTALAPPYTYEAVGRTVLELLDKWKDASVPDGPPEEDFWEDIPGCCSYQSFQRSHQLIVVSVEGEELSMRYMPRDGACGYRSESESVELRASFSPGTSQLTRKLGRAVWQTFRLAEVLDPLPSSVSEARK